MYEYLHGVIAELNPAYVVIDCSGVGYLVNISLQTYSAIDGQKEVKIFTHHVVREDAQLLYGFATREERELFRMLVSVSGVGANTARLILSSLSAGNVQKAIVQGDINTLKQIKGIGLKTAQRIIVDLKDKVLGKEAESPQIFASPNNTSRQEALSALVMLGFAKSSAEKVIDQLLASEGDHTAEGLIKAALKRL